MSIGSSNISIPHEPSGDVTALRISWPGRLLLALVFLWVTGVAFAVQFRTWAAPVIGLGDLSAVNQMLLQVALTLPPLLLLAWRRRRPRPGAMLRAWLWAAFYLLALTPARLWPPAESQWVLLTQLVVNLLILALIWRFWRDDPGQRTTGRWGYAPALSLAALFAYPWLAWGSLGSFLDTLIALALGLTTGIITARIIGHTWLASLELEAHGPGRDLFTGGLTMGATLVILLSGISLNGVQLLLMTSVSALAWAAIALSRSEKRHTWRPAALLLGLAMAAILALIDSDAVGIIAMDPLLRWAAQAAGLSILVGWLAGIIAMIGFRSWGKPYNLRVAAVVTALLWIGGVAIYFTAGQPGFYGDRIFVILEEQADVSAAAAIDDYDARREFVYSALVQHANQSQAGLRQTLDRLGVAYTPYYLVNGLEVDGGLLTSLLLRTRPEVNRILPSPVMRPLPEPTKPGKSQINPPAEPQWNLTNIGADRVWTEFGVRGQGVTIGQSDSGVDWKHPEVRAAYRGGEGDHDYNWLDPWTHTGEPTDYGGHGTHTLGSILGETVGVAPDATWYACANLQRNLGNPALYLACMQFMLAPYPQNGDPFTDGDPTRSANVLNNSWGCPEEYEGCDPESLLPAVRALRTAGIFVVASAGNDGPACNTVRDPIAIYDESFSVGAVDQANNLAPFSSAGPVTVDGSGRTKPDILAPGVDVLSAIPGDGYTEYSGTSMAGPHVAGVVALLWSANPDLVGDIDRTEQILIATATSFSGTLAADSFFLPSEPAEGLEADSAAQGDACLYQVDISQRPNNVAGYGVVNAYEAVKRALEEQ